MAETPETPLKIEVHHHNIEAGCDLSCQNPVLIALELEIDNFYEGGAKIKTHVQTVVPTPPFPPYSYAYEGDDWEYDHIFSKTGTGITEGDSAYFVTVKNSSRPDIISVGTTFEFGT